MDRNTLLALALSLFVVTGWMMWEQRQTGESIRPLGENAFEDERGDIVRAERAPRGAGAGETAARPVIPGAERPAPEPERLETAETWEVETPLYRARLSSRGAGIEEWVLPAYDAREDDGGGSVRLIDPSSPGLITRLEELGLGDLSRRVFTRVEGQDEWLFEFIDDGVRVRKRYEFSDDNYLVKLEVEVTNLERRSLRPRFEVELAAPVRSSADFKDAQLSVLQGEELESEFLNGFGMPGFLGFGKADREQRFDGDIVWAGLNSRYFVAALAPGVTRTASAKLLASRPGERSDVIVGYPGETDLPEGISLSREYRFYAGPKEVENLRDFGAQLERSIDLGWSLVEPITKSFVWLLRRTYEVVPNYGVAIILLTFMLRLVMGPLTHKQMKVMKKNSTQMAVLQPKIKDIQARYADDAQKRNEETMKIYREAGVNPLTMMGGGCLPMLLQLPIFIGLYYALQSAIELRGAPFGLWITDLSVPETLFTIPGLEIPIRVLPLAMGASMVIQQKMTPMTSMDPNQARMMMTVMPIMFTVLFYGFPSGLVLYWFVSNLLGMAQQLLINRHAK